MKRTLCSQSAAIVALFTFMFAKAATKHRTATYFKYTGDNTLPELTNTLNWMSYSNPQPGCLGVQVVCTAESVVFTSSAALTAYIRSNGTLPPITMLVIDSKKMATP